MDPLEGAVAGSQSLGIVEQSPGKGCCGLQRDGSSGCEGGDCGGKCLWRKARKPHKQSDTAESCISGGAITIASLSPHSSIGSWTIERVTHQAHDAPNYGVGPHPGGPFKFLMCLSTEQNPRQGGFIYVPDAWNNREGPQAREPSKCVNRQSCRGKLAKEPSDHQLPEAQKKTLIGP